MTRCGLGSYLMQNKGILPTVLCSIIVRRWRDGSRCYCSSPATAPSPAEASLAHCRRRPRAGGQAGGRRQQFHLRPSRADAASHRFRFVILAAVLSSSSGPGTCHALQVGFPVPSRGAPGCGCFSSLRRHYPSDINDAVYILHASNTFSLQYLAGCPRQASRSRLALM